MYTDIKSHYFLRAVLPKMALYLGKLSKAKKFQDFQIKKRIGWNQFYERKNIMEFILQQVEKNKIFIIEGYNEKVTIRKNNKNHIEILYGNKVSFVTKIDSDVARYYEDEKGYENVLFN